ncbi:MAG: hypothetical protein RBT65_05695 [Methanolobus sp.]|nr:hypothetical protein [Methanolobus sp.]
MEFFGAKCWMANILGTFECQGELARLVFGMLLKADDSQMKAFAEMGPSTKGQSDESCVQKAKEFTKEVHAKLR